MHLSRLRHALVSVPKNLFARDRDALIARAGSYACPADALEEVIRRCGFRVAEAPLPENEWANIEPGTRRVILSNRLNLKHASAEEGVRNFCLAHELGHIRLHLAQLALGPLDASQEEEANLYAATFLMPTHFLREHPAWSSVFDAWRLSSDELWEVMEALAAACKVTASAMATRLHKLGAVKYCRETRQLAAA